MHTHSSWPDTWRIIQCRKSCKHHKRAQHPHLMISNIKYITMRPNNNATHTTACHTPNHNMIHNPDIFLYTNHAKTVWSVLHCSGVQHRDDGPLQPRCYCLNMHALVFISPYMPHNIDKGHARRTWWLCCFVKRNINVQSHDIVMLQRSHTYTTSLARTRPQKHQKNINIKITKNACENSEFSR